jgi:hypothetical protein
MWVNVIHATSRTMHPSKSPPGNANNSTMGNAIANAIASPKPSFLNRCIALAC